MIQLITGAKGTGKTKQIIDMANANVDSAKGDIVFVTYTDRYMCSIVHQVRVINAQCLKHGDAPISNDALIGFIKGVLAGNHDIETLYVDGAHRILEKTVKEMKEFFDDMYKLAQSTDVKIVLTVSEDEDKFPEFMQKYRG
ncbi:MAG: hypothetical protein NC037_00015 [Bacteroides sp.]|nr:hypothetical protein [Bacillota bacterium]MCM1393350.1 hypothetical protein [[Eubacterium] siraeum]MCM1454904.1 hypothetical protein [Bacteroides sp.]